MPDRLAAILEMFLLFDNDSHKYCGLIDYCTQAIITDGRCSTAPWSRATDPDLCAYGQFWKTWNLTGKYPV